MRSSRGWRLSLLLEACTQVRSITQVHSLLLRNGLLPTDCFFSTKLTAAYAKVAPPETARKLFDEIHSPSVFLWNAILRAHCRARQWGEALCLFRRMIDNSYYKGSSSKPDNFTFPIILKACTYLRALKLGRAAHGCIVKMIQNGGVRSDMFVAAALVEMYAKCEAMGDAVKVFEGYPDPDVVLWTSIVTGYQQNGEAGLAVAVFTQMVVEECVPPDPVTLVSLLSALGQLGYRGAGKCCHGFVIRRGFDSDLTLFNSFLNFYAKLGSVNTASTLFELMPTRDVITWSCMVACYVHNEMAPKALEVYRRMLESGFEPNSVTVVSVLQACALAFDLQEGRRVHEFVIRKGFELETAASTALIDMYMKCSCVKEAVDIFNRMPKKDVVSWAALISGYSLNCLARESLAVFNSMLLNGTSPDAVTMVKVLAACSQLGILCQALCLHGYLVSSGFNEKVFVSAALIDLYSKCGSIDCAIKVFELMGEKDVVLWSSMIAGYGIHGLGSHAIDTFNQMIKSYVKPNNVTFVSLLSACSHAGLVEVGCRIFNEMYCVYGVKADSEHYGIMVDLLGRTGKLDEAMSLIKLMPTPVSPHVWCALLAGCKIHQNIEMGEVTARNLLKLNPNHVGYYSLLSNTYAFSGKWNNVAELRSMVMRRGLRKTPGYSSIEASSELHTFLASERSHQEWDNIGQLLIILDAKMREEGYVPDIDLGTPLHEDQIMAGLPI